MGVAPTGKRITFRGIAACRLKNGKIVEDDVNYSDYLQVLQEAAADA